MRTFLIITALIFIATVSPSSALADTDVKGYRKKDGTYVAPHKRSDSNSRKDDNWSSKGNTNPYTGKKGYKDPGKETPKKK